MKAKLFVAALATLAFASCSETETVEMPSSAAIKFDNAFVGNAVRGMVTTENLQSFKVFGGFADADVTDFDNVFTDVNVTKTSEGVWTPAQIQYWQANKNYVFQAYAGNATAAPTANGVTFTGYVVPGANAITGQEDLLVSNIAEVSTGATPTGDVVPMTFRHALAMVKFTIKSGFASNVTLNVANLTINNMPNKGDYTYTAKDNGSWALVDEGTEKANFVFGAIADIKDAAGKSTQELIVLPQAVGNLEVTFTVTATGALDIQNQPLTVKLPAVDLAAGQRVNFVATIDETNIDPDGQLKPITFNPTVTDWGASSEQGGAAIQQ